MHHPVGNDDLDHALENAAAILQQAPRVAVLTGAGISAESGVPTFRGAGGLWEGHAIQEVATPEAFALNPQLVWRFYNQRRAGLATIQPNPGHHALVTLEKKIGPNNFCLITQNVDGLHRLAGTQHLVELHGNLRHIRCSHCSYHADRGTETLPDMPHCDQCGQLLRPDIVWFGEMLPTGAWDKAEEAATHCDCFLVVGTSAVVYPAAGLIELARDQGAALIEINLNPTDATRIVDVGLFGPSGQVLPRLMALAFGKEIPC